MNKSHAEILAALVRGNAFYGSYSGAWGQRLRNAAIDLADQKLARIIQLEPHGNYAVIPPAADWDHVACDIRRTTA